MDGGAIRTERLLLRPLRPEDAEPIARLISDWEVIRWLTRPPYPFHLQHAVDFIAAGQGKHWTMTLDGTFIGEISVQPHLGYWLGVPWHGQGYMTEAARAAVDEHFSGGGAALSSGYMLENAASRRVLEKLGFRPTVIEREYAHSRGTEMAIQRMVLDPPPRAAD